MYLDVTWNKANFKCWKDKEQKECSECRTDKCEVSEQVEARVVGLM